jgi:hypothetical protein
MSKQQEIGEMRLGGMQPATAHYNLPTTFHISHTAQHHDYITFFCDHHDTTGEPLTWVNQNTINIQGQLIPLQTSPSHRTNWNTFTIKTTDFQLPSQQIPH